MIKGYEEKYVKDLMPSDVKVAVSGIVIAHWEKGIVVDDGTGYVNVETEAKADDGKFVKVFGYITYINGIFELKGNVIQDLSSVDRELYEKVKKLMTKR